MRAEKMDDAQLRDMLHEIDNSDLTVTSKEADFIESVLFKNGDAPMTKRQREWAIDIVNKYEDKL